MFLFRKNWKKQIYLLKERDEYIWVKQHDGVVL